MPLILSHVYLRNSVSQSIFLQTQKSNEIVNIICSLNIYKVSDDDNISSFFLRLGGEVLAPILSVYFIIITITGQRCKGICYR